MQFSVLQYSAGKCNALNCSEVQCNAVECSSVYRSQKQYSVVEFLKKLIIEDNATYKAFTGY